MRPLDLTLAVEPVHCSGNITGLLNHAKFAALLAACERRGSPILSLARGRSESLERLQRFKIFAALRPPVARLAVTVAAWSRPLCGGMRHGAPGLGNAETAPPRRSNGCRGHRPKPSTSYHRWPIGERCRRNQFASHTRKIRNHARCRCDIAGSKGLKLWCIFMSVTHGARLGRLAVD